MERLRHELSIMGRKVTWAPALVMIGFAILAEILIVIDVPPARTLSGGLEMIIPLLAGAIATATVNNDGALELQLTMPKRYQTTVMYRQAIIITWIILVSLLTSTVISLLGLGYTPHPVEMNSAILQFLVGQLTWIAPLVWCTGLCLCLSAILHSSTASATLLGCVWIIEIIYRGVFITIHWLRPFLLFPTTLIPLTGTIPDDQWHIWLTTRLEVLGMGLLLLIVGWFLLQNSEGILKGLSVD